MLNMKLIKYPLLFAFAASCSSAEFASSSKSKKVEKTLSLTCAVEPHVVGLGSSVKIVIKGNELAPQNLIQKISLKDSEEVLDNSELKKDNETYKQADGTENSYKTEETGNHVVQLFLNKDVKQASAQCLFVVEEGDAKPIPPVQQPPVQQPPVQQPPVQQPPVQQPPVQQPPVQQPPVQQPPVQQPPVCKDTEKTVGSHFAFLIDNSSSNEATDCPSPEAFTDSEGNNRYLCTAKTNREIAVIQAFDTLSSLTLDDESKSFLSITSFPTEVDFEQGSKIETNGWLSTEATNRAKVEVSMGFARLPWGLTPYGAAMDRADELFDNVADDGKSKVAVLVTDGEPTDRNARAVLEKAAFLKLNGIKVITVFVTGVESKDVRKQKHEKMLSDFNDRSLLEENTTWYDGSAATSFDDYIGQINGTSSVESLVERITSQKDENCFGSCEKLIIEVQDAESLKTTFAEIIKEHAIKCETK